MSGRGIHSRVAPLLQATNSFGGFSLSLVCNEQGLLIASSGEGIDGEDLAAFTSLFDSVVDRATRDLGFGAVDEVTLLDPGRGRTVIRPLRLTERTQMFLVVQLDPKKTWRRHTNQLCVELVRILAQYADDDAPSTSRGDEP